MASSGTLTFTMSTSPTVTATANISASINSSNTVTFAVDWVLKALSSPSWFGYGVKIQYRTAKKDSSGSWSYGSWTTKATPITTSNITWSQKTGSFSVTLASCTAASDARIQLRLISGESEHVGTAVTFSTDIVTITLKAGIGISSVSKSPNQSYHLEGDSITAKATLSSTTGYTTTWQNWTSNNTSAIANSSSQTYTFKAPDAESVTLTANGVQTPYSYTVKYNGNGATSGTMADSSYRYDKAQALSANTFKRTGYTFKGWATTVSGSVKYSDQQSVYNLTATNGATVTLYAVWAINSYTLTVKAGTGVSAVSGGGTKTYNVSCTAAATVKTGYTFVNWTSSSTSLLANSTSKSYTFNMPAGAITLTANAKANTYTIAYNNNGGTGSMTSTSCTYDVAQTLRSNTMSRIGYTFSGWNTKADGTGTKYANGASVKNLATSGTVTLYAQWTINSGKIYFHPNGGTATSTYPLQTSGTYAGFSSAVGNPNYNSTAYDSYNVTTLFSRTGYRVPSDAEAWRIGSVTSTTYMNQASANLRSYFTSSTGVVLKCYANWTPIQYTVHYEPNNGTGSMTDSSHVYDTAKALSENKFSRDGYKFTGWNTTANGSGTSYSDKQSVKNLTSTNNGKITLYAQWEAISYTVKYNANGGTGTMANSTHTFNVAKKLTRNIFAKTGYSFLGWGTSATSGVIYKDEDSVIDLTKEAGTTFNLYAIWQANTYMVLFDSQEDVLDVTFDEPMPSITTPTLTGYIFAGYYSESGIQFYNPDGTSHSNWNIAEHTMLYAKWLPINYTIRFDGNGYTSGEMPEIQVKYDAPVTLPLNQFKKHKWFFTCWKCESTTYKNGEIIENLTVEDGTVITLIAQWKPMHIGYYAVEDPESSGNYIWKLGFVYYYPKATETGFPQQWLPCYANICKKGKWLLSGKKELT